MGSFKKTRTSTIAAPSVEAKRKIIADVTHEAVCELTGTSGLRHCALYAWIGLVLASGLLKKRYHLQCGTLSIRLTDTTGVEHNSENDGLKRGEFHCWFGAPDNGDGGEIVDLSARHYRGLADSIAEREGPEFAWPATLEEREYIWAPASEVSNWIARLKVDAQQTQQFMDSPQMQRYLDPASDVSAVTGRAVQRALQRMSRLK